MTIHSRRQKHIKIYQDWLCKNFPNCFNGSYRPLSIGIFNELAKQLPESISKTQLRSCIVWYTTRIKYYEALCGSIFRVNIDGSNAEEISHRDKEDAQLKLIIIYMRKSEVRQKILEEQEKSQMIASH